MNPPKLFKKINHYQYNLFSANLCYLLNSVYIYIYTDIMSLTVFLLFNIYIYMY